MKTIILMAALAAFTLSAHAADAPNGQPAECSIQQAVKANAFIKKYKKPVEMKDHDAHRFVWAISQLTDGKQSFHDIERIVFVEVNPEEHMWMAFMFGNPVKGKDCFWGAIPMPARVIQRRLVWISIW